MAFKRLLPEAMHQCVISLDVNTTTELIATNCRIATTSLQLDELNEYYKGIPSIYHIEFPSCHAMENGISDSVTILWKDGSLPTKCKLFDIKLGITYQFTYNNYLS